MDYEMEELLPVVAKLTDKYTSKESSSVPYEAAKTLMEAVLYCINECFRGEQENMVLDEKKPDAWTSYERGYEIVVRKVVEAKKRYESLLEEFEDYGCYNYRDTILKGMPVFFTRYDAKFNPQNHLLTLDYPLITGNPDLCGVDLILRYLNGIRMEKRFLDYFERQYIANLLEKMIPDYTMLYLDNICYPVLLNAIGCVICDKPIGRMEISSVDYEVIKAYFLEDKEMDSIEKMEGKIRGILRILIGKIVDEKAVEYFEKVAPDYAVRMGVGIREDSLRQVMISL